MESLQKQLSVAIERTVAGQDALDHGFLAMSNIGTQQQTCCYSKRCSEEVWQLVLQPWQLVWQRGVANWSAMGVVSQHMHDLEPLQSLEGQVLKLGNILGFKIALKQ
jgi:hypothetical protein